MPIPTRVIVYTRVSTHQQADGDGLGIQLAKVRAYTEVRGFRIAKVFREVFSGVGADSISNRPELQKALELARKRSWPILVGSIDRLGRDEETVIAQINDPRITIISVENGEKADKAVLAAQARQAKVTAKIISKTTKAALKARKKEGVLLGNRKNLDVAQKLGSESNHERFRKRAEEYLPILKKIDPDGTRTRKQIVDALNEHGLRTDRGFSWTPGNFRRLHDEINKLKADLTPTPDDSECVSLDERHEKDPLWGIFG